MPMPGLNYSISPAVLAAFRTKRYQFDSKLKEYLGGGKFSDEEDV